MMVVLESYSITSEEPILSVPSKLTSLTQMWYKEICRELVHSVKFIGGQIGLQVSTRR